MNLIWKSLLALTLVVPLGGALAWSATQPDHRDPTPRDAIVIRQTSDDTSTDSTTTHQGRDHAEDGPHRHARGDDDGPNAESPDGSDDEVTDVHVEPEDVGDDHGDHGEHAEPGNDHGGSGSDDSGSGSGSDDSGSDDGGHSGRG